MLILLSVLFFYLIPTNHVYAAEIDSSAARGNPIPIDPDGPPMTGRQLIRCDLNEDRKCDSSDSELFMRAFGQCMGGNYNSSADVDGDGCVTSKDQEDINSYDPDDDGALGFNDECPLSDYSTTVIIERCDTSVKNIVLVNGCAISDMILNCRESSSDHSHFVSCVTKLTNDLKKNSVISDAEEKAIQGCSQEEK